MKLMLAEMRKNKGMTQDDLATSIGISKRIISSWERGETPMKLEDACIVSDFFMCSLDDFAGRTFDHAPKEKDTVIDALTANYNSMNASGRARLAETAEAMVRSGMYQKRGAAQVPSAS